MGKKKDSRILKLVSGTKPKHIPGTPEPQEFEEMWPCPSYIGEYGNELWHRVGPTLIKAGVLTSLDAETFEILCITYDRIRQFQKILDKEGCIISDARKSQKRHPAVGLLNQYLHTFLKLSEEFRLTPNSRERYGFNWPDENDEDELI